MAANDLIVVLDYSIKVKSVILLVNINYLQLQVVFSLQGVAPIQMKRWFSWLMDFQLS